MKNPRSAWITYTVLRLLFFAVPFALIYLLGLSLRFSLMLSAIVAAVFAALIGVSLSLLLLTKPREAASESIYDWRNRDRTADDIAEDDAIAAAEGAAPAAGSEDSGSADRAEGTEGAGGAEHSTVPTADPETGSRERRAQP
ncbi:DUF4229 domain-containing protein [Leucobacter sp.]